MLILKRFLAFSIDYLIIISYAVLLFIITQSLSNGLNLSLTSSKPIQNQLVAFFTLTLPVIIYSVLTERSSKKGTIGKRVMNICVEAKKGNILKRNILKFLPWELAHIGVHWIYFYETTNKESPIWVWVLLIVPQLIIIAYIISIIYSKGRISLYDRCSETIISSK